jgi:hypothetical protein
MSKTCSAVAADEDGMTTAAGVTVAWSAEAVATPEAFGAGEADVVADKAGEDESRIHLRHHPSRTYSLLRGIQRPSESNVWVLRWHVQRFSQFIITSRYIPSVDLLTKFSASAEDGLATAKAAAWMLLAQAEAGGAIAEIVATPEVFGAGEAGKAADKATGVKGSG